MLRRHAAAADPISLRQYAHVLTRPAFQLRLSHSTLSVDDAEVQLPLRLPPGLRSARGLIVLDGICT